MSNPCFDTPSPPELCQRLCMSSATSTPIPDSYYDTNYTTIFSLDNNNQTQGKKKGSFLKGIPVCKWNNCGWISLQSSSVCEVVASGSLNSPTPTHIPSLLISVDREIMFTISFSICYYFSMPARPFLSLPWDDGVEES